MQIVLPILDAGAWQGKCDLRERGRVVDYQRPSKLDLRIEPQLLLTMTSILMMAPMLEAKNLLHLAGSVFSAIWRIPFGGYSWDNSRYRNATVILRCASMHRWRLH